MLRAIQVVTLAAGLAALSGAARPALAVVVPPPEECSDRFTGGGFIYLADGSKATFGVGGGIQNGDLWGHLNYIDHSTGMHVHGTSVTSYTVTGTTSRRTTGVCTIDGVNGTYTLDIADNGEPGTSDTLTLTLSTGYSAGGTLGGGQGGGGNIQLHKSKCKSDDLDHMDDFVGE